MAGMCAFLTACFTVTAAFAASPSDLPPLSGRSIDYVTHEVTWPSADLSPDGRTILFDILGDIYALDAAGGNARPVLTGPAYETQATFSPDGKHIAFISDRSGRENLWIADADGQNPRRISNDTSGAPIYSQPAWSPDSKTLYASRMTYAVLAFEIWSYDVASGEAKRITLAKPRGTEGFNDRSNTLGVAVSPDGRYLYYAIKTGTTWTERKLPHWHIVRRDLQKNETTNIMVAPGGSMQPALSHDGKFLVYATRDKGVTGLRLRDLTNNDDRALLFPVDPDGQEGGYYSGLLPRYSFTPDDRALLMGLGGGLKRLDLATGKVTDIPFTAAVHHEMGPQLRVQQKVETGPVNVRIVQNPRLSPDGRSVAFGALGRIYVAGVDGHGSPREVAVQGPAWQPNWSPDGKSLVYVTWTATTGGQIWSASAFGSANAHQLTHEHAFYTEPMYSADGSEIIALRASDYDRLHELNESGAANRATDIIRLKPSADVRVVAQVYGARSLAPGADPGQVRVLAEGWISSVSLASGETHRVVRLVGIPASQYVEGASPLEGVRLNRAGTQALVRSASELFLVPLPANPATPPVINITEAASHAVKLTAIGATYFDWSQDSRAITWSVGATFRTLPVDQARAGDQVPERRAHATQLAVSLPRDVPHGSLLLTGAKVATMRGNEVIDNADILVTDNRIAAIGPRGSVRPPAGTTVRDIAGKFVVPGFIDVHAHWFETRRDILDIGHWDFLANLAYGVTAGLEVQAFDTDVFNYADMIDVGMMPGPRAFSTGQGIFMNADIRSKQDALDILTRYRDYFHTRNIKEYMTGDRTVRRYMAEAAADLGMMMTTEGASDLRLDLTQALDGYPGNEHALPIAPLHDDIMQLLVRTRISYSPTLMVLYGAPEALGNMVIQNQADVDDKLRHFMPDYVIANKTGSRGWTSPEDTGYPRFAAQAMAIQRAGGLLGVGSHGMVQGLNYHWEMEAQASGGASPMEVLHAATIGSAEVIGRATDLGSIEPGKLADLLILDRDPALDIRNTKSIASVMKNGRLYNAATLDEQWPRTQPLPHQWFQH